MTSTAKPARLQRLLELVSRSVSIPGLTLAELDPPRLRDAEVRNPGADLLGPTIAEELDLAT